MYSRPAEKKGRTERRHPPRCPGTALFRSRGCDPVGNQRENCASAIRRRVVEAAGVEPASENVTGQETTCLFQFMPWALVAIAGDSPRTFAAHAQNGQETLAASL